jgi:hypothetical protein
MISDTVEDEDIEKLPYGCRHSEIIIYLGTPLLHCTMPKKIQF